MPALEQSRRAAAAHALAQPASWWFAKPEGMRFAELLGRMPAAELWQRQMVLGPSPEFCLFDAEVPARFEATMLGVRALLSQGAGGETELTRGTLGHWARPTR